MVLRVMVKTSGDIGHKGEREDMDKLEASAAGPGSGRVRHLRGSRHYAINTVVGPGYIQPKVLKLKCQYL